jgi:hypothetical protein
MKTASPILAVALLFLFGCSSTHIVERAEAPAWGPGAVEQLAGKTVRVALRDGRFCEGEILRLDVQQITLRNWSPLVDTSIPMDSVLRIESASNAAVTMLGVVEGALVGALVGATIGGASGPAIEGDRTGLSTFFNVASGGMVGAGVGALLGGAIVGAATSTHDYTIVHSPRPPQAAATIKRRSE